MCFLILVTLIILHFYYKRMNSENLLKLNNVLIISCLRVCVEGLYNLF